jgi:hypothetical protein
MPGFTDQLNTAVAVSFNNLPAAFMAVAPLCGAHYKLVPDNFELHYCQNHFKFTLEFFNLVVWARAVSQYDTSLANVDACTAAMRNLK